MPLSRFRRPLFLVLAAYMAVLCGLRHAGFFDADLPDKIQYRYSTPAEAEARLDSPLTSGLRARAFMTTSSIDHVPRKIKILAWLPPKAENAGLLPGTILKISGRLRRPRRPRNPGDFDEHGYLSKNGAAAVLHVSRFEVVERSRSWPGALRAQAELVRRSIGTLLQKTYPPQIESVLRGILLGDKASLDAPFSEALKTAGAFHLIVPSGTNVAFVLVFFLWISKLLRLGRLLCALFPLAMAAFYGLVVGYDPPYLRAFLCASLACLFKLWDGEQDMFQALTLSALLLLIWNPRLLFRESFQMSYVAVLALLLSRPHKIFPRHWPRPARLALELAAASAAVQIALLPILAQIGGKFSLIGILSNIALVPLCGLIMGAGYALWIFSFFPFPAFFQEAAAAATGLLAESFRSICLACAAVPHAALDLWPMPLLMVPGYYLLLLGVFFRGRPKIIPAMGIILMGLLWIFQMPGSHDVRVIALSLPGSGASLINFPGNKSWLVYGGGPPKTILTALKFNGITRLDKIVFLENTASRTRYRRRIREAFPRGEVIAWKAKRPFALGWGEIRLIFNPDGPRIFKGEAEYSALPGRLRQSALDIVTDGASASFRNWGREPSY